MCHVSNSKILFKSNEISRNKVVETLKIPVELRRAKKIRLKALAS